MFDTQILLPCFSGPGSDSTGSMSGAESFDNYSFSSVTSVQTADAANASTSRDISSASSGAGASGAVMQLQLARSIPMEVPGVSPLMLASEPSDSGISDSLTSSYCGYSNQTSPYISPSSSASNSAYNSMSSIQQRHSLNSAQRNSSCFVNSAHHQANNSSSMSSIMQTRSNSLNSIHGGVRGGDSLSSIQQQRASSARDSNSYNKRLNRSFTTSLELPASRLMDDDEPRRQVRACQRVIGASLLQQKKNGEFSVTCL